MGRPKIDTNDLRSLHIRLSHNERMELIRSLAKYSMTDTQTSKRATTHHTLSDRLKELK